MDDYLLECVLTETLSRPERKLLLVFEDEIRRRNSAAKKQLTSTTAVTPEFLTQNLSAAIPLIKA